ncbi:hypothetical protein SISSUDRAFT_529890 [Sistotremastrum suecicum HHB10207 ss-3]|uniref:Uncharacterized protein n=1 Tax=Sistotremastrum suecicum HHB10207 ss-3 TaxID=1314776 RepID=A0A166F2P3_9AGAM|nr:hypothetical protein SISSUDRAFT_529890 [Sistotremastrum suecicum HHB10207 ss-3]
MPDPRAIEETDDDVSYGRETIDDITTVLFHPAKAIMIVVEAWTNDGVGSGIYEADIPSDMPLLVHGMSVDIVHWSCREIKPREIPRSIFPFRQGFDGGMLPMGFRALSDSTWVLDVVIVGEYVNLECREPDDKQSLIVSRVSFDLSDWSQTSDFLEYSLADPQETNFLPHGNHRLAGSAFFILLESNRCQIVAPKFGNGNGHAMGWVQLDVPPALSIRVPAASYKMRPDGEDWKAVVSAFDMKMGKLYICLPDGLHVLQY